MLHYFFIFLFISAMIIDSLTGQIIVFILIITAFIISKKPLLNNIKILSFIVLFTVFFHIFVRFDGFYFEGFYNKELWIKASFFTLRNSSFVLIMTTLIFSLANSSPLQFIKYLELHPIVRKYKLKTYTQPVLIGLIYFSMIKQEYQSTKQLHRILRITKPDSLIKQVSYYLSMILPLLISSLERSEYLAAALTSRGFGVNYD